ncbi:jg8495 [Pararge aegeria aegeria]|uniref:Jg8495 protein n=1 Tax=Pararge aegeria aegeria TaxID=348720 RepID=A0A8S4RVK1_9NEOP|nr:jg8495 [Pararge aegeria aegeria]
MLVISLRHLIRNVEIRRRTRVSDIAQRVTEVAMGQAHSSEKVWTLGSHLPRCWNGRPELVSAALVVPNEVDKPH